MHSFTIGIVSSVLTVGLNEVFVHRGIVHNAFQINSFFKEFIKLSIRTMVGQSHFKWFIAHVWHHIQQDTKEDPHSPKILGFWRVFLTSFRLYTLPAKDPELVAKYGKFYHKTWVDSKWYFPGYYGLGGLIILMMIFGLQDGFLLWCGHLVGYALSSGFFNAYLHSGEGGDAAINSKVLGVLFFGVGLHKNHHRNQKSARNDLNPGELDTGWYIILAFQWLGLIWDVRDELKE